MRFERLDLNLLVALDVLIEERSVSVAAKRLFLSQPAVSGALNRLREYFRDDLLVQVGRQMMLTPKAEELRGPVREALMLIRTRITTPTEFDPATAERRFTIVASDFVYTVLLAPVFAEAARVAPNITFDVQNTSRRGQEMMDRGEADLMITIAGYLSEEYPQKRLFEDEHAVIAWSEGRYGAALTEEDFREAGHAVVLFGRERHPAFTETFFEQKGVNRRIQVRVPTFSALPAAVLGSDRIATMFRRHAEHFARLQPISIHQPPLPLPNVVEAVQWHSFRADDAGLKWLLELLTRRAAELDAAASAA